MLEAKGGRFHILTYPFLPHGSLLILHLCRKFCLGQLLDRCIRCASNLPFAKDRAVNHHEGLASSRDPRHPFEAAGCWQVDKVWDHGIEK